MRDGWAISMLISGGLFAGGVLSIAWERLPAWRGADLSDFRIAFAHTLRRVDRLQPALATACLASTLGFAASAGGAARTPAFVAAGCLLAILLGSAAVLIPIQRRLVSRGADLPSAEAERLRTMWLRGHTIRAVVALAALVLAVVAATS
jgi:hypothetical protein